MSSVIPVRNLGQFGVITDVDPFDLPPTAFTMGVNARFEDNKVSRGPVFRGTTLLTSGYDPRYVISYKQLSGPQVFLMGHKDGRVTSFQNGVTGVVEDEVQPDDWTPTDYEQPYTGTINNDVVYLNRPDHVPWYRLKGDTDNFKPLPAWNADWRAQSLRSLAGTIVAIGITKAGVSYGAMVKTSDFTVFGAPPAQWSATTTNSATENILADLQDALVDGMNLRDKLILYSTYETWEMSYIQGNEVFGYRRLFTNYGAINANCAAEVNNTHYVFGPDDIWQHDGYTPQRIGAGKVRNFIYGNLVREEATKCFVVHQPRLNEVMFCYVSKDPYVAFPASDTQDTPGCNRAAVYNYRSGTWYFYDLPYLTAAGLGIPSSGPRYSDMTESYSSINGSYSDFGDGGRLTTLTTTGAGSLVVPVGVRSFDLVRSSDTIGDVDTAVTKPVRIEKDRMDLDELGIELRGYKNLRSVYPEGRFQVGAKPLMFSFGSTDYPNSPDPAFDVEHMTFDGHTDYKLDFKSAGRYLAMAIDHDDVLDFSLSGLDFDLTVTGHR